MHHLDGRRRRFEALVELIVRRPRRGVLHLQHRQDLHHHRAAVALHHLPQAPHALVGDHLEVQGFPLEDHAEADQGVDFLVFIQRQQIRRG